MQILQHRWEKINDCFKGPDGFHFRIDYSDGSSFSESTNDNLYMKLFIRNFTLRPSCHACRFKKVDRDSDITIGDCWNAGESIPEFKGKSSISLVIVYSTKGKENLSAIKDKLLIYKGDLYLLLPSYEKNGNSVRANRKRKIFFDKLKDNEKISSLSYLANPSVIRKIYWACKKKIGNK